MMVSSSSVAQPAISSASESPEAKRLQNMKEAIKKLDSLPSPAEQRKAIAAWQLELLKQRLKMLMMFAGAMNKKSVAAEAAQIAKEIGGAVAAYTQSGGDAGAGTNVEKQSAGQDAGQGYGQLLSSAQLFVARARALADEEEAQDKHKHRHGLALTKVVVIPARPKLVEAPLYTVDGRQTAPLISQFSAAA